METVAEGVRLVHVVFGFVGLAAFWVPVFSRKGARRHVFFGRIFVRTAYVVLAGAALATLLRVAGLVERGVGVAGNPLLWAFIVFLGYLTYVTFVVVRHGMGVLRHKQAPGALRTPLNVALAWGAIAASLGLIAFAAVVKPGNAILLYALSPIGIATGFGNLRYLRSARPGEREWLFEHLGAMLGAGIAFHTAFAVFGATRLFDIGLTGWVAVIPWVLPAAIGIPATALWTRHYRRKFARLAAQ